MILQRKTFKFFLSNLVVFLLFNSIFFDAYYLTRGQPNYFLFFMFVPFIALFFVRDRVASFVSVIILHLVIVLLTILIPFLLGTDIIIYILIFTLLIFAYSIITWRKGEFDMGIAFIAVLTFIYILSYMASGSTQLIFAFVVTLVAFMIYRHMENIDFRISLIRQTDKFDHPATKILSENNILVIIFAVFIIIFTTLFAFAPISSIIDFLSNTFFGFIINPISSLLIFILTPFFRFFGWFIGLFSPTLHEIEDVEPGEGDIMAYEMLSENPLADGRTHYIVAGILVFVILIIAAKMFSAIKNKYIFKDKTVDMETISLGGSILNDLLDLLPKRNQGPKHHTRKMFYNKVKKHTRNGVNVVLYDTTDIIAAKIKPKEDINALTNDYEKVRYGK